MEFANTKLGNIKLGIVAALFIGIILFFIGIIQMVISAIAIVGTSGAGIVASLAMTLVTVIIVGIFGLFLFGLSLRWFFKRSKIK